MSESNAIVPTSQKTILFYDDEITAVVVDGDEQEVYIPLRPLCNEELPFFCYTFRSRI